MMPHLLPVPALSQFQFPFPVDFTSSSAQEWPNMALIHPAPSGHTMWMCQQPQLLVQQQLCQHYQNYVFQPQRLGQADSGSSHHQVYLHNLHREGSFFHRIEATTKLQQRSVFPPLLLAPGAAAAASDRPRKCSTSPKESRIATLSAESYDSPPVSAKARGDIGNGKSLRSPCAINSSPCARTLVALSPPVKTEACCK